VDPLLLTEWDIIIGADLVYNNAGVELLGRVFKAFCRVYISVVNLNDIDWLEKYIDILFAYFESL
jgi:hypothetical protein